MMMAVPCLTLLPPRRSGIDEDDAGTTDDMGGLIGGKRARLTERAQQERDMQRAVAAHNKMNAVLNHCLFCFESNPAGVKKHLIVSLGGGCRLCAEQCPAVAGVHSFGRVVGCALPRMAMAAAAPLSWLLVTTLAFSPAEHVLLTLPPDGEKLPGHVVLAPLQHVLAMTDADEEVYAGASSTPPAAHPRQAPPATRRGPLTVLLFVSAFCPVCFCCSWPQR